MHGYILEMLGQLLRWLHVVAAMAWVGESFYFVALDQGLQSPRHAGPAGIAGESWSVHGGGFYHKQKYMVAPAVMPEVLHWSKWKAYATWLSGFALLLSLYMLQPDLYLIDPAVAPLRAPLAIALALGILLLGWLVYDGFCRILGDRNRLIALLLGLWMLAIDWLDCHLFAGRAAWLLTGAVMASIMSANVFFVIIPGQRRMVDAMARGETPDPEFGRRGKQRSVHNTYLTLPVVFAMLSNHFAIGYARPDNWLMLALIMLGGALIRQFFVLYHGGRRVWWLPAGGTVAIVAALAIASPPSIGTASRPPPRASVAAADSTSQPAPTPQIMALLARRCAACHASHPTMMATAPKGLDFQQPAVVARHAYEIYSQAALLRAMPLGNITHMTDEERVLLAQWYQSRTRTTRVSP